MTFSCSARWAASSGAVIGGEHRRLARPGRERDDGEQVGGFAPAGADFDDDAAAGGGGQAGQREAAGEVGRGLGGLGHGGDHVGDPSG